jgi:hypothetical protein
MAERSELEELRRLDELEKKASGAAFVTPKQRATPVAPEVKERVSSLAESAGQYLFGEPEREEFSGSEVGGATAGGAGAGLVLPKVLEKGGRVVSKVPLPYAKPIGGAMQALGIGMGKIPALTRAYKGGLGGAAGSTVEQGAELAGAPKIVSLPAGLAAGGVVPELEGAIKKIVAKVGSAVVGTEGMANAIMRDLRAQGVEVTPKIAQLIEKEVNAFRQSGKGKAPQESLYGALKTGATDITREAENRAAIRLAEGKMAQQQAQEQADKMRLAGKKTTEIGAQASAEGKAARAQIGQEREVSDIGNTLRQKIMSLFGQMTEARSAEYNAQKAIRDAAVAAKEDAGQYVKQMPEYQDLMSELRTKLLLGKEGREQATAKVSDTGVKNAYRNIYDAVADQKVQIGIDTNGNPAYKTYPTAFEALDDVRRRLGDVAFGKEVEGYSAIGADIARKYYGKISEIQSKFAGESHDKLQGGYEAASRLLDKYKSQAGKKATAADRFDPTRFKTDPAALPNDYFKSKQSVADLLELTGGDRALVTQTASDFTARQLRDKSAKEVKSWLNSNSDWLEALPEIKSKVSSYLSTLERAERVSGKTSKAADILGLREPKVISKGAQAMTEAEKEAGKITGEAQKRADLILGSKFPNEEIEKLMLTGDVARWNEVAPILARSPEGRQNIEAAVRQVMSRVSPKSMGDTFRDNVRQRLETTKLLSADKLDQIQNELDSISNLTLSPEQKMSLLQRITRNLLTTGYAQTVGAPAGAIVGSTFEE